MHRLFFLIFSIVLVSCGVTKTSVIPESFTTFTPELNKITNTEIGNILVSREQGHKYDAIEITKEFKIELDYVVRTIEEGNIFINRYKTNTYDFYSSSPDSEFGIAIERNGENPMIYTKGDNDGIYATGFSYNGINLIRPKEKIVYIQTKELAKEKDNFKQEFIYNGRVRDALKFIYREYKNDYARPAFIQDLQYDLSESKIIGFRGMRVEIINATNTEIEYKVLNYFEN
ncbi:hypothetical protein SAMN04515667_0963 [Formosa sp. Hel1_31_208]|uniref:hypothetical protein n=1 Tax=Formosa sp. Hel1_31_208 TaxID=1798225 RepID=UPI00087A16B6|nr:hypothetical protein [Formosa sp. Hel1_31_208]SDR90808.1 hypothetical protein SAMN04515667_0963 [Formosa sp. Hel1_31_208]